MCNMGRAFLTYKHRRNCMKYGVFIRPNSCGPGLRIVHIGGIHLNCASMGANCTVTQGSFWEIKTCRRIDLLWEIMLS